MVRYKSRRKREGQTNAMISIVLQSVLESTTKLKEDIKKHNMDNYPPGAANDPRAPYNKPTYIECPDCEGEGYFGESACCGALIDEDILICSKCLEHSEKYECDNCNGTGTIKD